MCSADDVSRALNVPPRKNKHPEFAGAYWQAALAPTGDWLALVWRRPELQGANTAGTSEPRGDAMHIDNPPSRSP